MPRRGDICQHFNTTMFRYYLRKRYKNQRTFAKRIDVTQQAVSAWANGDKNPTWKHVIQMANVFNIPARQLLGKQGKMTLDLWQDHLIDYQMAPPELKHEKKITILTNDGSITEKKVERELKLTSKEAIELTEKMGIFDDADDDEESPDDRLDGHIP